MLRACLPITASFIITHDMECYPLHIDMASFKNGHYPVISDPELIQGVRYHKLLKVYDHH